MTEAVKKAIDACSPSDILRVGGAGHKVCWLLSCISATSERVSAAGSFYQAFQLSFIAYFIACLPSVL